jgi:NTP pyrophosphatase (non-canonical NTP hydrolase)
MFGLTKREQRWKADQQAAELLLGFVGTTVKAAAAVRVAEAEADAAELKRLREENAGLLRDLRMSANVIGIQLQTIKELEAQIAAFPSTSQGTP